MNWLPTMATRWAKQLSLLKEMNSDRDSKEKFDLKEQPENLLHHHQLSFPAKF
jgi:hypothetical protein